MECYIQARNDAMTKENIQSGWSRSGLWDSRHNSPRLQKALNNRLIINKKRATTPIEDQATIGRDQGSTQLLLTPQKGSDLRQYSQKTLEYTPLPKRRANRRLFSKIRKGLDNKNSQVAMLQQEVLSLKATIALLRPQRRKRVYIDANKKFATIEDILESRAHMQLEQAVPNSYVFEEMCFEWNIHDI